MYISHANFKCQLVKKLNLCLRPFCLCDVSDDSIFCLCDVSDDSIFCLCDVSDDSIFCFISDKTTICGKNKFGRGENLLDHPYNCTKYITCTKDHTFSHEAYVLDYKDGRHVFDRAGQRSASRHEPVVACAVQERT